MILGKEASEIVKKAVEYQSQITDGVVQYDYEDGEIFGAGFTTGTIENPANPFIEIFRLPQGEMGEINMDCSDCPYDDEAYITKMQKENPELYPETSNECCLEAYIDDGFEDDFENNFKESVEHQIYDVLDDFLFDTLDKLNDIRIAVSDITEPWNYVNVRQEKWIVNVLDSYVDTALEYGFTTTECEPIEYIDAEVQYIAQLLRNSENKNLQKAGCLIEDGNLDEALELLH